MKSIFTYLTTEEDFEELLTLFPKGRSVRKPQKMDRQSAVKNIMAAIARYPNSPALFAAMAQLQK